MANVVLSVWEKFKERGIVYPLKDADGINTFGQSVGEVYQAWLRRQASPHTRHACDLDVMCFARQYLGLDWPAEAGYLLDMPVATVQAYRDCLVTDGVAPKEVNRRLDSLSRFYEHLYEVATERGVPMIVGNPASSGFIPRAEAERG